ncbi:MAG: hypothetical protein KDN19_09775 [Verrucomicrobiae bacterium]|nr:hypothetical protein [Verrucomicrobiae bacterium]
MAKTTFPKLSERVFAVRAAWRRQIPLRVRVEAVREAVSRTNSAVPVINGTASNPVGSTTQPSSIGGPPARLVRMETPESRVA